MAAGRTQLAGAGAGARAVGCGWAAGSFWLADAASRVSSAAWPRAPITDSDLAVESGSIRGWRWTRGGAAGMIWGSFIPSSRSTALLDPESAAALGNSSGSGAA